MMFSLTTTAALVLTAVATNAFEISSANLRGLSSDGFDFERALSTQSLASYSAKWQGCFKETGWNPDFTGAEGQSAVITQRYVRYRLCPTSSCKDYKSSGCSSKYGDYFMNMNQYVALEYAYHASMQAATCANAASACSDADNCDLPSYCSATDNGQIDIANYLTCAELTVPNITYDADGNQIRYYVGPECSGQGGSISMGLFSESSCSIVSSTSFNSLMGYDLDFSTATSLTSYDCLSCLESVAETASSSDSADTDTTIEFCESIYAYSGKCEVEMLSGDQSACSYIATINILREDGSYNIETFEKGSTSAAVLVGLFSMTSLGLAFYVYTLKKKQSESEAQAKLLA